MLAGLSVEHCPRWLPATMMRLPGAGGVHPGVAERAAGDGGAGPALPRGPARGQPRAHQRRPPLPALQRDRPGLRVRQPLRHALPPRAPPHLRQAPRRHRPRQAGGCQSCARGIRSICAELPCTSSASGKQPRSLQSNSIALP